MLGATTTTNQPSNKKTPNKNPTKKQPSNQKKKSQKTNPPQKQTCVGMQLQKSYSGSLSYLPSGTTETYVHTQIPLWLHRESCEMILQSQWKYVKS